ncbi:hypothetical protein ElyMa_004748100 [Elysia marginata]|uniref:TGF-beta family profile domain-containing protein n=1 Tax=Elysia marginata TaxID=1093978 RepID=A0AAV4IHJ1_9GAST|nr:hypothetical protein ElyMa_004748100 [Elysia marginata]
MAPGGYRSLGVLYSINLTGFTLTAAGHPALRLTDCPVVCVNLAAEINGLLLKHINKIEILTQTSARVQPFDRIEQGLTYATNKALSDQHVGSSEHAAAFPILNVGNDIISVSADIISKKVNDVVATSILKTNPVRVVPNSPSALYDAISENTKMISLNKFIEAMLLQNLGNIASNKNLNGIVRRAETFHSKKPGEQLEIGFGLLKQRSCVDPPASARLNLTSVAYDYPQNSINLELHQRTEVMLAIFRSRRPNLRDPVNQTEGYACFSTKETLEAFYVQGVKCWLIFPRHQNVQFYRCRRTRCGQGVAQVCSSFDEITPLWAWCNTTFEGHKIIKFQLPLPVSCVCQPVTPC